MPKNPLCYRMADRIRAESSATDLEACVATFKRNGFSRDDALLAIGRAQGLMRNV